MAAGSGGRSGMVTVWKEEEMFQWRWQIDATAKQRRALLGKPRQEVKFEFQQSMETGGEQFSWRAWANWEIQRPSTKVGFVIALQTVNSEGGGSKSLPEERVAVKVENEVGGKVFECGPFTNAPRLKWTKEIQGTYYSWMMTDLSKKAFEELKLHGRAVIVTFILKTSISISITYKNYWPSEFAIKEKFYNMITNLENDKEKSDLKIISSDGKEFFACRWILAVVSEVFEAMFRCDMREKQSGVLKMDDLSGDTVKTLLHFIYSGEVAIEEWSRAGIVEELIYAADKYQIAELKNYFDAKLGIICTAENAGALLAMAEKTSLKKAVANILAFIRKQCKNPKGFFEIVKKTKTD